jgi:hypothetical protein
MDYDEKEEGCLFQVATILNTDALNYRISADAPPAGRNRRWCGPVRG